MYWFVRFGLSFTADFNNSFHFLGPKKKKEKATIKFALSVTDNIDTNQSYNKGDVLKSMKTLACDQSIKRKVICSKSKNCQIENYIIEISIHSCCD